MYESTIENLSDAGRFYAIDLPGQGYSDAFPDRPTLPGMVNVISEFCEAIGAKSVVLGGHAVGSIISIEVAARRPELVDACILQSTPFYTGHEDVAARHAKAYSAYTSDETGFPLPRTMKEVHDLDMVHSPLVPTQEWLDRENRELIMAGRRYREYMQMAAADIERTTESLSMVKQPALCIWGETFLYAERRNEILSRIQNSQLELIPNSGIFPQIDNPTHYEGVIRKFLAALPPAKN